MTDIVTNYIENILIIQGQTVKGTMGSFLKRTAKPCFLNDLLYPKEFGTCNETCPMYMSFGPANTKCILSRGGPYA